MRKNLKNVGVTALTALGVAKSYFGKPIEIYKTNKIKKND